MILSPITIDHNLFGVLFHLLSVCGVVWASFVDKCGVIFVVVATIGWSMVAAATAATTTNLHEEDNDLHTQHCFLSSTKRTKTNNLQLFLFFKQIEKNLNYCFTRYPLGF